MKELTSAFDADSLGIQLSVDKFVNGEHVIAGALKQFLRELPEPILCFSMYDAWIRTTEGVCVCTYVCAYMYIV